MSTNFKRCAMALAVAMPALTTLAQSDLVLEEVIVTAQIRAESLQDVPVSVSALSGDKIMEAGIYKIEDLQNYVPNLVMSETGLGTNIYIRGIGSGINQGFEQSVGMYVDGVYYGRAQLSRAPFLDLARVEVLRGPQNILYGKNSIAGAMSVVTQKPGDEFEGLVSATYEPEYGEQVYDAVVSGPITDDFGARFAYRKRTLDGFVENIDFGDEPERDEETARLVLRWDVTSNLDATMKYEHGTFDVKGRQIEIVGDQPSLNPALGGANWSQTLASFPGVSSSVLDVSENGKRSSNGDFSENTTDNLTLTVNYAMGEYTLTSITAGLEYDYDELCDCDFTGADLFFVRSQEEYEQISQEFRITSPVGETFEWIAGGYYQKSELNFQDRFYVSPTGSALPNLLDTILPVKFRSNPADPNSSVYPAGTANMLMHGLAVPREFEQDSELWSGFAQVTWNIRDDMRLTVGGRYSYEEKEASRTLTATDATGAVIPYDESFIPNTSMGTDYLLGSVFKVARHDLKGDRDEDNFSPLVTFEYDVNDDLMAYATWTKGYKSGGYDVRSNAPPQDTVIDNPISSALDVTVPAGAFDYDEEQAESIEVGFKSTLAGGAAEINMAYFYTEYDKLQVSIYDGVLGFNVGNAAEAVTQGVEMDGRWLVSEGLTFTAALAWLDFEFKDYDNGQCTQAQRIVSDAAGQPGCSADFAGKSNQYVAELSGTIGVDYLYGFSNGLQLRSNLDVIFSSDYNPSQNVDDNIEQGGYYKLNGRIALSSEADTWEVSLIGKNLMDQEIITYANDTPLSANLVQSVGYYALVEPGRTLAIQGLYRF